MPKLEPSLQPAPASALRPAALDPDHPLYFVWAHAPVGMAISRVDGQVVEANPALCQMLGYTAAELRRLRWQDFTHPDDVSSNEALDRRILARELDHFSLSKRYLRKDGRVVHAQLQVTFLADEHGQPTRLLGVVQDVTEHVLAREHLAYAALHDALTGLPNRRWFVDALQRHLTMEPDRDTAVLFVDLDNFKTVNDSIGHHLGDQFLVKAGERIRSCLPPGVSLARYGGDEFTVLVPGPDAASRARRVAACMHVQLQEPLRLARREVYCSASIGLAVAHAGEHDANSVMRNADIALYRAKDAGRARTMEFTASMAVDVAQTLALQTELRRAASRSQLRLHYQPIVDLETRLAIGFEALLRWQHPTRGLLTPGAFWDQAEESGLGPRIAHWAIPKACRAALSMAPGKRGPYISVNLSMRQLADPQLLEVVDRALGESGLPGRRLRIEVTESVVAHDVAEIVEVLDALRDRGLRIYMDDFGTGVSSYARLHRLPLDALKIDRAFVSAMAQGDDGRSLVRSILTLSSSLGLPAIAEGVETEKQRTDLLDLGCLWSQGYLFGRPMPLRQASLVPRQL